MPARLTRNILFLAISLTTAACAQVAQNPESVASRYWTSLQAGNTDAARQLVSSQSHADFDNNIRHMTPVGQFKLSDTHATVTTVLNPGTNATQNQTFDTVLVLENGQWRIDASRTQIPVAASQQKNKLAKDLSSSMQKNMDEMDKAMHDGIKLLNDALHDGSREMGDSLLKGMKQLNESMQRSIEQLKHHRQQKKQVPAGPDPRKGEGAI